MYNKIFNQNISAGVKSEIFINTTIIQKHREAIPSDQQQVGQNRLQAERATQDLKYPCMKGGGGCNVRRHFAI